MIKYDGVEFDKVDELIVYKKWVLRYIDKTIKELVQPVTTKEPERQQQRKKRSKNVLALQLWTTREENNLYQVMKEYGFKNHTSISREYIRRYSANRTIPAVMTRVSVLKERRLRA